MKKNEDKMNRKNKKNRDNSASSMFRNISYALNLIWKVCPGRIFIDIINGLCGGAAEILIDILLLRYIFKALVNDYDFTKVVGFILLIMIVNLVFDWNFSWYNFKYRPVTDEKLYKNIYRMMFEKANQVDLSCYENPEFYDMYTKSVKDIIRYVTKVSDSVFGTMGTVFSCIMAILIMIPLDKTAVFFVLIPIAIMLPSSLKINKIRFVLNMANLSFGRRKDYVQRTIYLNNYAKEIRISNIFSVLSDSFFSVGKNILANIKKYGMKISIHLFLIRCPAFVIIYFGSVIYALYRCTVSKTIPLDDFVVLISVMTTVSYNLFGILWSILTTSESVPHIQIFKKFMDFDTAISETQKGDIPEKEGTVVFKDVSYTYTGQDHPALKKINFEIRPGEKIAVVGHNGAGKTTLVKLLMRLYDVSEGEITWNGKDIKKFDLKKYRDLFGIVFQDYQVLSVSINENVMMRKIKSAEDVETAKQAMIQSGIYDKVMTLNKKADTTLTKEFDDEGTVLSGGENQKVSIARVFAKPCSIAVFDEPSSALDPVAEYNMYESMMKACKDKSVIFISHRLSSTIIADRIYMFENGEIIESGSHKDLMDLNGKYAEIFRLQAERYHA